jgi:NAD(P)-dependent dehydrogenase (short-subunit alcohol dehydrogenase family)
LAARARDLVGQVDVLVNNAGFFPFGPTEHTTEQMLARFGTGVPIEKGELSDLGRRCQKIHAYWDTMSARAKAFTARG